jgi:hypothetical protein
VSRRSAGFADREHALDIGSDLATLGIPFSEQGAKISGDGEVLRLRDAFGAVRGMASVYLEVIEPAVKNIEDSVDLPLPDATSQRLYGGMLGFRAERPNACLRSSLDRERLITSERSTLLAACRCLIPSAIPRTYRIACLGVKACDASQFVTVE